MFWDSEEEGRRWQLEALARATSAVGNREEVALVVGEGDPEDQARRLLGLGLETAFLKLGPEGALAAGPTGVFRAEPVRVEVVNGLGAGDAFGGAVCHGLLAGWELERIARFANAAGAIVAGRLACADAMPTEAEVLELLHRTEDPTHAG
jgi:5-dehydro-2-deoxygluconokinase